MSLRALVWLDSLQQIDLTDAEHRLLYWLCRRHQGPACEPVSVPIGAIETIGLEHFDRAEKRLDALVDRGVIKITRRPSPGAFEVSLVGCLP